MYAPFWSVTNVVDVFRLTLRIVTWAPGTSCPVESSTVPAMLPVETCAAAGAGGNPTMVRANTASIAYIRLGRVLVIDISTRATCLVVFPWAAHRMMRP